MSKTRKQTRRSISVKGITYQRIRDYFKQDDPDRSVSGYIEDLVKADLDKKGIPVPKFLVVPTKPKKKDHEDEPPWGNHFTF